MTMVSLSVIKYLFYPINLKVLWNNFILNKYKISANANINRSNHCCCNRCSSFCRTTDPAFWQYQCRSNQRRSVLSADLLRCQQPNLRCYVYVGLFCDWGRCCKYRYAQCTTGYIAFILICLKLRNRYRFVIFTCYPMLTSR